MVGQIRSSKAVRAGAGCWEPALPRRRRLVPRSTTTTGHPAAAIDVATGAIKGFVVAEPCSVK